LIFVKTISYKLSEGLYARGIANFSAQKSSENNETTRNIIGDF